MWRIGKETWKRKRSGFLIGASNSYVKVADVVKEFILSNRTFKILMTFATIVIQKLDLDNCTKLIWELGGRQANYERYREGRYL